MVRFALVKRSTPQTVVIGESIEFDPVNGGWLTMRQSGDTGVMVPLSNVAAVYPVDPAGPLTQGRFG